MNEADVALKRYLREIGPIPLLTPQEEVTLARRIQKGDSAAREWMIQANLRLVVAIAQDYVNLGLPLLDLISEGNIGLMKAVDRFDPKKGAKQGQTQIDIIFCDGHHQPQIRLDHPLARSGITFLDSPRKRDLPLRRQKRN